MLSIDDREPVDVVAYLKGLDVPTTYERRDVADYAFIDAGGGLVLVSRKASDLYTSAYSGHMQDEFEKCIAMINSYGSGRLFWIQEGVWSLADPTGGAPAYFQRAGPDWFRKGYTGKGAQSVYAGMQVSASTSGIDLLVTGNLYDTAVMLATLYRHGMEGWPSKITQRLSRPELKWVRRDTRIANLMGLWPHLTERQARALLKEFGDIGNVLATAEHYPETLIETPGIGKKTLANLVDILAKEAP